MSVTDAPFLVSVITPVYNAAPFVRRAVESAVGLPEVGEIILVDDAGPDDALEICRALEREYPKVRLLRHPDHGNHGAGASRNLGIAHARFDFIAFLDADDFYLPHRFQRDREILTADPAVDGVYSACGVQYENEEAQRRYREQGHPEIVTVSQHFAPEDLFAVLFSRHKQYSGEFHTDAITVRSRLLARSGLFNENLPLRQDTHMWRRMACVARLSPGEIEHPVALRGIHGVNRMLNQQGQAACEAPWWSDLQGWVCSHHVSDAKRRIFDEAYCSWKIETYPRHRARRVFIGYVLRRPSVMLPMYGFFDLNAFKLFGRGRVMQRLVSAKNRLVRFFGR